MNFSRFLRIQQNGRSQQEAKATDIAIHVQPRHPKLITVDIAAASESGTLPEESASASFTPYGPSAAFVFNGRFKTNLSVDSLGASKPTLWPAMKHVISPVHSENSGSLSYKTLSSTGAALSAETSMFTDVSLASRTPVGSPTSCELQPLLDQRNLTITALQSAIKAMSLQADAVAKNQTILNEKAALKEKHTLELRDQKIASLEARQSQPLAIAKEKNSEDIDMETLTALNEHLLRSNAHFKAKSDRLQQIIDDGMYCNAS
jgi:hypothetical protein